MVKIYESTKEAVKRGTGHGTDYTPWIKIAELPGHIGTHHNLIDWKTGRTLHLLSNGELWQYLILRWSDDVVDIREQYPIPTEATQEIVNKFKGFRHPRNNNGLVHFTTDLLVDYSDGHQEAFSIKSSREQFEKSVRQMKNEFVIKRYWDGQNVPFHIVFTDEMNRVFAENIQRYVYYWDPINVVDKISLFKFLIAHKMIEIYLESEVLDSLCDYTLANEYISDQRCKELINIIRKKYTESCGKVENF